MKIEISLLKKMHKMINLFFSAALCHMLPKYGWNMICDANMARGEGERLKGKLQFLFRRNNDHDWPDFWSRGVLVGQMGWWISAGLLGLSSAHPLHYEQYIASQQFWQKNFWARVSTNIEDFENWKTVFQVCHFIWWVHSKEISSVVDKPLEASWMLNNIVISLFIWWRR